MLRVARVNECGAAAAGDALMNSSAAAPANAQGATGEAAEGGGEGIKRRWKTVSDGSIIPTDRNQGRKDGLNSIREGEGGMGKTREAEGKGVKKEGECMLASLATSSPDPRVSPFLSVTERGRQKGQSVFLSPAGERTHPPPDASIPTATHIRPLTLPPSQLLPCTPLRPDLPVHLEARTASEAAELACTMPTVAGTVLPRADNPRPDHPRKGADDASRTDILARVTPPAFIPPHGADLQQQQQPVPYRQSERSQRIRPGRTECFPPSFSHPQSLHGSAKAPSDICAKPNCADLAVDSQGDVIMLQAAVTGGAPFALVPQTLESSLLLTCVNGSGESGGVGGGVIVPSGLETGARSRIGQKHWRETSPLQPTSPYSPRVGSLHYWLNTAAPTSAVTTPRAFRRGGARGGGGRRGGGWGGPSGGGTPLSQTGGTSCLPPSHPSVGCPSLHRSVTLSNGEILRHQVVWRLQQQRQRQHRRHQQQQEEEEGGEENGLLGIEGRVGGGVEFEDDDLALDAARLLMGVQVPCGEPMLAAAKAYERRQGEVRGVGTDAPPVGVIAGGNLDNLGGKERGSAMPSSGRSCHLAGGVSVSPHAPPVSQASSTDGVKGIAPSSLLLRCARRGGIASNRSLPGDACTGDGGMDWANERGETGQRERERE